jgi:hypothetical protein
MGFGALQNLGGHGSSNDATGTGGTTINIDGKDVTGKIGQNGLIVNNIVKRGFMDGKLKVSEDLTELFSFIEFGT